MRSNSHITLPRHLHLADLDGDGSDELIQVAGNRLLVSRVNAESTGVLHAWFTSPVRRVITGRFTTTGRIPNSEQLLVELGDGSLRGLAASDDRQELWWWFTQPTFLRRGEHVIVGDVDGDGRDELLVQSVAGALRCYAPGRDGPFAPLTTFAIGNLERESLRGKEIYVGEFGQQPGRSDLVVIDRDGGRLSRYDSATDRGKHTFWWAFTTAPGLLGRADEVCVANIEGGATDGLIVRHRAVGTYRLLRLDFNGGHLGTATGADVGQLPVVSNPATMVTTKVKEAGLRRGRHEPARHDVLLFDRSARRLTRTDARYDPAARRDTYWFAFSAPIPGRDTGWPSRTANDRWAVVRSKLSDTRQRGETDFYQRMFTRPGGGGMVDYFMDISYGQMDISRSDVYPADDRTEWYDCGYTTANSPRGAKVRDPFDDVDKEAREVIFGAAVRASGLDLDPYGHAVAVFNVANTAYGGASTWVTLDAGGLVTQGTAGAAQEMLHGYGLGHSLDAAGAQYGDPWDIMSGLRTKTFADGFNNAPAGPDMNATTKDRQGFIPADRVLRVQPGARRRSRQVRVAALNRPEAAGVLMVRVQLSNSSLTIEFRQRSFWDRGIPNDAVLVHQDAAGSSLLQSTSSGPELLVGDSMSVLGVTVTVDEIHGSDHGRDPWASTALVTVRY